MPGRRHHVARLIFCMLTIAAVPAARAQDAEPRSYSNAPVGLNFLIAGYAYTRGGLSLDPALPIDNDHLRTNSAVLAYARAFGIGGMWASLDATYFAGGRTTINDRLDNNLQRNWRVGATFAFPLDRRNSLKAAASTGVSARTGNNFDLFAIAWQYRWGAGT